jgi:hypothetical protein
MAARIRDVKDELKDIVFGKRIKTFKVLPPNQCCGSGIR